MQAVYTLNDFMNITFNGFDIKLPDDTISTITELSLQVGSPTYVKTPTFVKKEIGLKSGGSGGTIGGLNHMNRTGMDYKKKRRNQAVEILNDEDWESIRTFQATVIEQKVGVDAQIDVIRSSLNKMSEKNYEEHSVKIVEILNQMLEDGIMEEDMKKVGNTIFEIASNNRFFSKLYADLYTLLIDHFKIMGDIFGECLDSFLDIFKNIEKGVPEDDYDKYCKVMKDNERRKALTAFFVNLTINGVIQDEKMTDLTYNLLKQVSVFIGENDKKSEVDEIIENIAILYNKDWFENSKQLIDDQTFLDFIKKIALSKAKDFPSLSNRSIFKCMDMIEM